MTIDKVPDCIGVMKFERVKEGDENEEKEVDLEDWYPWNDIRMVFHIIVLCPNVHAKTWISIDPCIKDDSGERERGLIGVDIRGFIREDSSLFQNGLKNKEGCLITLPVGALQPSKANQEYPHKPRQMEVSEVIDNIQASERNQIQASERNQIRSSKPFTFLRMLTPDMVPDVHPRKIVTIAWIDQWNWSLVLAKVALICLF